MTEFTEESAQKCFDYLQTSEEEYAQVAAAYHVAENRLKALEARLFMEAEGAQEKRKMEARASQEYRDLVDEVEDITAQYRLLQARRNRCQNLVSAWQSSSRLRVGI